MNAHGLRECQQSGNSVRALDVVFMAANSVGIVLYLWLASRGWRIPEEHGMIPVTGEPFVWALALPVLGRFLLADAAWGVFVFRGRAPKRRLAWLVTVVVWLFAIVIDFSHH